MDLSIFSQDHFDPKDWINSIFQSQEAKDGNDVKQFASSAVMRLQLAIQEVNSSLEETSSQVVSTIPRVLRDVEALTHEASLLRTQMKQVKEDIEKVETETATSMQTLVELDTLKSRLTASSRALKEADNWTTLSSDIEEIMESGDLEAIYKQLISLQNCLAILTRAPDYEDRVAHLDGLKVRFEALASPHLVAAFTQHNLENSKKFAKMLHELGRSRNLENFYHKCELQQLLNIWSTGVEGHLMSGPPVWLISFYDKLSTFLSQQVQWCDDVFENNTSGTLLAALTYSTLSNLDPSLKKVVDVSIKQQEEPLAFLSALKNAGDAFLQDYKSALATSTGNKETLNNVHREVFLVAHKPLKEQMLRYQDYEESLLLSHLISADIVRGDMSENVQRIREYSSKLCFQAENSIQRCNQISEGLSIGYVISALKTYIENFNDRLSQVSRHVQQQTVSTRDDWTVFNSCLNLIQAAGELLLAVDSMEHLLASAFKKILSQISWNVEATNPFLLTPNVLLSVIQEKMLKNLKQKFEEDDARLLESSLTLAEEQCQTSVDVALSTITAPISNLLAPVPGLSSWSTRQSSNLSASLSPQEYVTKIGQYLMTLPQHLDPLLVAHSPALNRALQEVNITSGGGRLVSESEISAADFLIGIVGHSTCKLYTDIILRIPDVSPNMVTQLTTDIDYICNILEDLGVTSCDPLSQLNALLKAPMDQYWSVSPGKNPRLVAAVRQIRNIPVNT